MAKFKDFFLVFFVTFYTLINSFAVYSIGVQTENSDYNYPNSPTRKIYSVEVDQLAESDVHSVLTGAGMHHRYRRQVGVDTSNFAHQVLNSPFSI